MAEEKHEAEVIEKKKSNLKPRLKWIGFALIGLTIIGFLILKISDPEFPIKWILFIGIPLILAGLLGIKGFDLYQKFKGKIKTKPVSSEDGVPLAAPSEVIEKKLEEFISSRENEIKDKEKIYAFTIGHNEIYAYKVNLWYEDGKNGKEIWVLLNSNYLKRPFAVLPGNSGESMLRTKANGMSSSPEKMPDTEEIEEESPLTGVTRKIKKTKHKSKEDKKKEEKEDIA